VSLFERIRHKCIEDGDCLMWQGSMQSQNGSPFVYTEGRNRAPIRKLLWEESGKKIKDGHRIGVVCRNARCVAPEHLVQRSRRDDTKGRKRTLAEKARISETKRAKSPLADVAPAILASEASDKQIADELGLKYGTVWKIRRRVEYKGNPFVGLGARQ
jgi:hypothetical protein